MLLVCGKDLALGRRKVRMAKCRMDVLSEIGKVPCQGIFGCQL